MSSGVIACHSLRGVALTSHDLPQVARKHTEYVKGTPEAAVQAAIIRRFGAHNTSFFVAVSNWLDGSAKPASVKGAFYRAMRSEQNIPDEHQPAYADLLGLPPRVIERVGRESHRRRSKDPLQELREEVEVLTKALEIARGETRKLARRVAALEKPVRTQSGSPPRDRASRGERTGA